MSRRVQPVRGRQQGGALRPDPYPVRNEGRLARRARCVVITGSEVAAVQPSLRPIAMRVSSPSCQLAGVVTGLLVPVTRRESVPAVLFVTCCFYRLWRSESSTGFFFAPVILRRA